MSDLTTWRVTFPSPVGGVISRDIQAGSLQMKDGHYVFWEGGLKFSIRTDRVVFIERVDT